MPDVISFGALAYGCGVHVGDAISSILRMPTKVKMREVVEHENNELRGVNRPNAIYALAVSQTSSTSGTCQL